MPSACVIEPGGIRLAATAARLSAEGFDPNAYRTIYVGSAAAWMAVYALAGKLHLTYPIWVALTEPKVFSPWNVLHGRRPGSVDAIWEVCQAIEPIDLGCIDRSSARVVVTLFRYRDGAPLYIPLTSENAPTVLRATCAIPFVTEPVYYHGDRVGDGGGVDPIPLRRALEDGHDQIDVYLSRPCGYRIPTWERFVAAAIAPIPGMGGPRRAIRERFLNHADACRIIAAPSEGVAVRAWYPEHRIMSHRWERNPNLVRLDWETASLRAHGERRTA